MVGKRLLCEDIHKTLPESSGEKIAMLRRTLLLGVALAAGVALLVDHAAQLGPDMTNVALLGAALGAVAALVPDGTPFARIAGALVGMVITQVGYGVRAAVLPDIPAGPRRG